MGNSQSLPCGLEFSTQMAPFPVFGFWFPATLPEEPVKLASRARDAAAVTRALPFSRARTK